MTKDLPTLIFATLLKLSVKKARVWASGLLPHTPRTPRHHLLPSPEMKPIPLSTAFRRASLPLSHATSATALAMFVERKDIGSTNVQTRLTLQQSLALTLPSPTDALHDLQVILDVEIHMGTTDTTKKGMENSKQTSRVGNIFL